MKKLNEKKLYEADFPSRLLSFARDYGKATNVNFYDDVVDWFIDQNYIYMKSFLSSVPLQGSHISQPLLDRKKTLYEEFISFYE